MHPQLNRSIFEDDSQAIVGKSAHPIAFPLTGLDIYPFVDPVPLLCALVATINHHGGQAGSPIIPAFDMATAGTQAMT